MRAALLPMLVLAGCTYGAPPDRRTDFVVIFPPGAERPDPALLDRAATAAAAAPDLDVTVDGFAGPPGTPEPAQIAARLRAQTVADGLLIRGVARQRISLHYRRGIGAPPEDEARRVEIRLGS